jgi:squalene-hopene/tetraprenyl-beta-curcumene cyclase
MRVFFPARVLIWASLGFLSLFGASPPRWNPTAAAQYLDQREAWWAAWPSAARGHDTFCVSCHTAVPFALARPLFRAKTSPVTEGERALRENVARRVELWATIRPYYSGQENQSRGTEAVLNALILSNMDANAGKLSTAARESLRILWTLQERSGANQGAWPWINFYNEPWEAADSPYYGATLAALAVGIAPDDYQAGNEIRSAVAELRDYLVRERSKQSAMNQAFLLWASGNLRALLTPSQRDAIAGELLAAQRSDGGWSTASIAWSWRATSLSSLFKIWTKSEEKPLQAGSDGLATGLVVVALRQAGIPADDARLVRATEWLVRNQDTRTGQWPDGSLNTRRDPSSGPALFMTDASTAFAALALASQN